MLTDQEIDVWIAEYVLGHQITRPKKGMIKERTKTGSLRPLRRYTKDISAAWEVVEKLGITLLPIKGSQWFALVGPNDGWEDPAELIKNLSTGDFARSGAAITQSPALSVCLAALRSIEKREGLAFDGVVIPPAATEIH